jgi:hypothetical protein
MCILWSTNQNNTSKLRTISNVALWTPAYTPGDGQTSWVYSSNPVLHLYISCYLTVNKPVLSCLLLCLLPQPILFFLQSLPFLSADCYCIVHRLVHHQHTTDHLHVSIVQAGPTDISSCICLIFFRFYCSDLRPFYTFTIINCLLCLRNEPFIA